MMRRFDFIDMIRQARMPYEWCERRFGSREWDGEVCGSKCTLFLQTRNKPRTWQDRVHLMTNFVFLFQTPFLVCFPAFANAVNPFFPKQHTGALISALITFHMSETHRAPRIIGYVTFRCCQQAPCHQQSLHNKKRGREWQNQKKTQKLAT